MSDTLELPSVYDGYVVSYQLFQNLLQIVDLQFMPMIVDGWIVTVENTTLKCSAGRGVMPYIFTTEEFSQTDWSSLSQGGKLIAQRVINKENTDEKGNIYSRTYDLKLVIIPKTTPTPSTDAIELGTITRDQTYGTLTYKETAKRLVPMNDKDNLWYIDNGSMKSISIRSLIEASSSVTKIGELEGKVTALEGWKGTTDTKLAEIDTLKTKITQLEGKVNQLETFKTTTESKLTELEGRIEALEQAP